MSYRPYAAPLPRIKDVGCNSHFMDSGSFSLWTKAKRYFARYPSKGKYGYYDTKSHWQYVDDYARFLIKYKAGIDLYANVDVIPNPELSWRNLKYLEKEWGLNPVPVVHYTTDLKWLTRHIEAGYKLIAIGGLVRSLTKPGCRHWLDRAFDLVCSNKDRLPCVGLHGFGVTTYDLLLRFPWFSVDSTSWTKVGAYGGIFVPHKRGGRFVFNEQPYIIKVSDDSPDRRKYGCHINNISKRERKIVEEWLAFVGVPLGMYGRDGKTVEEEGVCTRHTERKAVNILFFELMRQSLPDYPWPFPRQRKKGLGLIG